MKEITRIHDSKYQSQRKRIERKNRENFTDMMT